MANNHTLVADSGGTIIARANVTPDNGINTFNLPFVVDDPDFLYIWIDSDGVGLTGATFIAIASDRRSFTMNVATDGATTGTFEAWLLHSIIR